MPYQFEVGKPACPVACKYCHVTELDANRTAQWSKGLLGLNKACTFMNVPPWVGEDKATRDRFYSTPWHLFAGDFVGWTAVTDGFMPSLRSYFWHWVEKVSPIAKLITVVTKWPINKTFMRELAEIPNLFLVITITGNREIETIPPEVHLRSLALAKEFGVKCLPMCHPYIAGVSDLSFLPKLVEMGYSEVCIKGLRYNPETMGDWMPKQSKPFYEGNGTEEILPEDGWRDRVANAELSLLTPKQWYWREGINLNPCISRDKATSLVDELLPHVNIASSAAKKDVIQKSIERRIAYASDR